MCAQHASSQGPKYTQGMCSLGQKQVEKEDIGSALTGREVCLLRIYWRPGFRGGRACENITPVILHWAVWEQSHTRGQLCQQPSLRADRPAACSTPQHGPAAHGRPLPISHVTELLWVQPPQGNALMKCNPRKFTESL